MAHHPHRYISRVNSRDKTRHVILATASYRPLDFASQLNVSLANGWGIIRAIIDLCMKQPEGKYVLVKDPNKVRSGFSLPSLCQKVTLSWVIGEILPEGLRAHVRLNSHNALTYHSPDSRSSACIPFLQMPSPKKRKKKVQKILTNWNQLPRIVTFVPFNHQYINLVIPRTSLPPIKYMRITQLR